MIRHTGSNLCDPGFIGIEIVYILSQGVMIGKVMSIDLIDGIQFTFVPDFGVKLEKFLIFFRHSYTS